MMVNPRSGKPMRIMIESVATPTSMTVYDGFVVDGDAASACANTSCPRPRMDCTRPSSAN